MLTRKYHFQSGSIFVEFSLVALLLFVIIGSFIQFAMTFYQYNLLNDSMTSTMRRLAAQTNTTSWSTLSSQSDSNGIPTRLKTDMISKGYIKDPSSLIFPASDLTLCRSNKVCRIITKATWHVPCLFCVIPFNITTHIRMEVPVEDACFLEAADCLNAGACS